MSTKKQGYRRYTTDGTYWTVRKYNGYFWAVRIDPSSGTYTWAETWGGYVNAGPAAGAAAQLAYLQGVKDAGDKVRSSLHDALESVGLGAPLPPPAPIPAPAAPPTDDDAASGDEAEPV